MEKFKEKHAQKIRFLLIGGLNTVLDFVLLFFFVGLGVNKFIANFLSTTVTMIISFFANKTFTFKNTNAASKKQFIIFIAVTASGLWLLQPLVIWLVSSYLVNYTSNQDVVLFTAKALATAASLVWNYLLYSRLVFAKNKPSL